MRIAAVESRPLEVPLSRPYTIAFKSFTAVEMTAVKIVAESGEVGLGNASPEPAVTGETFADCNAALDPSGLGFLVGADVGQLAPLCREIERRFADAPAARAALDMALHDLWARSIGRAGGACGSRAWSSRASASARAPTSGAVRSASCSSSSTCCRP